STNWRSVSQWCPCTTPPYKNGTIARPLPKTNIPALAKYRKISHNRLFAGNTAVTRNKPAALPTRARTGNDLTSIATTPTSNHNQMISREVHAVETASTPKITHSIRSEEHTSELQSR